MDTYTKRERTIYLLGMLGQNLISGVIGTGLATMVEDVVEKKAALCHIVKHYSSKGDWAFTDAQAAGVAVVKITVAQMACKEHD